jgi:hypothetical protein
MKKVLFAFAAVLALATTSLGAAPALFAQNSAQPGQITIKDQAEYNDYQDAMGQPTPQAKAAKIEAFLQKYPNSVVKTDMLQILMMTYYQMQDTDKTVATAKRLLEADPTNVRAITLIAYADKTKGMAAMQTNPASAVPILDEAAQYAQKGLSSTKPAGMTDADFEKLKATFYSAIALDDEAKKDNPGEVQNFNDDLKAYSDPNQTTSGAALNDTLLLAEAYAQATPPDYKSAAWYFTRVAQFAPPAAKAEIEKSAEYYYNKYHGSMDGYPAVQALAKANLFPPAAYNPTPAPPPPSPADLAHQTVVSTPDLTKLSLSDREFILYNGNPDDAQKVWGTMKGERVGVPGVVIAATAEQVELAVTQDNQQAKKADFTITMKPPLKTVPAIGANVTYDATFDSYTTNPPMITLVDGSLPPKAAPVHHHTARRE